MSSARYSVIIVHYKRPDLLASSILRLLQQTVLPDEIVIIDNGETLNQHDFVGKGAVPTIVKSAPNPGYAAAVNLGRLEMRAESEFMLVLTHDAEMKNDCVEQMSMVMGCEEKAAVVGPVLRRTSDPDEVFSVGGWWGFGGRVRHANNAPDDDAKVNWIDGAIMFHRTRAFDSLGGISEQYFLYYEEVDYCWRAHQAGYSVIVAGHALATQEPGNFTPYLKFRNHLLFAKGRFNLVAVVAATAYMAARSCAGYIIRGQLDRPLWAFVGISHGIIGVTGRPPVSIGSAMSRRGRRKK